MVFEYELDGTVFKEENVEKEKIVSFINQMTPRGKSYCILTADDESYVQCAGAKIKLTIEYRKYENKGFKHFVIGCQKEGGKNISVMYSGGYISVKENEVLTRKDAIHIFETFFNTKNLPSVYKLRETTEMFSDK